jgi:uncharacterized membrane protein HdeD (DUF308 family)
VNKYVIMLNYAARGLVILVGIFWVSGFIPAVSFDTNVRMFGVVFILFGVYRVAMFWSQQQEYNRYNDDE